MEQNPINGGNSVGRNMFYVIVAVLAIVFVVYLATNGNNEEGNNQNQNTQNSEQQDQNQNGIIDTDENENNETVSNNGQTSGDVTATGTLRVSDNPNRGNLMVDSNRGKIYIATARDFGNLIDRQVTLNATGTIHKFVFLGFNEGMGNFIDTTARGGAEESSRNVSFTGTLNNSDNSDKGNYMITSANGKIYLKSVHNHSAKVGQTVTLSAEGTLNSFTNAVLN